MRNRRNAVSAAFFQMLVVRSNIFEVEHMLMNSGHYQTISRSVQPV